MLTENEITLAYNRLPLVRAKKILGEEKEWSDGEVQWWLRWANGQDPLYDWPFVLATHRVPDFSSFGTYREAKDLWELIVSGDSSPYFYGDDANNAIAVIIFWLEGQEAKLDQIETWDGINGYHYVDWSPEEGGHVKIWAKGAGDRDEPTIFKL